MKKAFILVSDIEMGRGDIMDDFSDDHLLAEFIDSKGQQKDEVHLILNGDIFDFLKMDYRGDHTRYITEEVSQWKLERVFEAHSKVFDAWRNFLKNEKNHLFFVIGNHDFDLIWPSLQERIRAHLGNRHRVNFDFTYQYSTFHAEHGNFFDPFFQNNRKKPFVTYKGQKLLNLPIGCQVVFSHLAPFKRKYPKEEQLYPRGKLQEHHPEYMKEIKKLFWMYAWKVAIDPIIHLTDPTYRVAYGPFIRHALKYGLDFIDDSRFLEDRLREIAQKHPDKKVFGLAHSHVFLELMIGDKYFLATDTWRDEYNLTDPNRAKKPKSYAEIRYSGLELEQAHLKIYHPSSPARLHQSLVNQKTASPTFALTHTKK